MRHTTGRNALRVAAVARHAAEHGADLRIVELDVASAPSEAIVRVVVFTEPTSLRHARAEGGPHRPARALGTSERPLDIQVQSSETPRRETTWMPSKATERVELLQGTLDLIVLRALDTMGAQHAYGLAARLEQVAQPSLTLNQGTLYPALVRLEQRGWIKGAWQRTETNREAKYYSITRAGGRALHKQAERWRRLAGLVEKLLLNES
jgi:transcriptional regulator